MTKKDDGVSVLSRYECRTVRPLSTGVGGPSHWPTPELGTQLQPPVRRSVLVRNQYQRMELTLRRWRISRPDARSMLQVRGAAGDFLRSEQAYLAIADQRTFVRAELILNVSDAIDRLSVDRYDQDKWIRRTLPDAANMSPLMIMKSNDTYLRWFVSYLRNRTYFG